MIRLKAWVGAAVCGIALGCGSKATPPAASMRPRPVFDAESAPHAAAKKVAVANGCLRCHTIHLARAEPPSGSQIPMVEGGELRFTGAIESHTVEWFMGYIRNPEKCFPGTRMPSFEGKISEPDLRALAEYLSSLK